MNHFLQSYCFFRFPANNTAPSALHIFIVEHALAKRFVVLAKVDVKIMKPDETRKGLLILLCSFATPFSSALAPDFPRPPSTAPHP